MATITAEPDHTRQSFCDWCTGEKGVDGRYLLHNALGTNAICNHCITRLHIHVMQIDFLRFAPVGEKN